MKVMFTNDTTSNYITKDKHYQPERLSAHVSPIIGASFNVQCDYGQQIFCNANSCAHLGGGAWIFLPETQDELSFCATNYLQFLEELLK